MLGAPAEGAGNLLECSPGSYSSRSLLEWDMPDEFDADDVAQCLLHHRPTDVALTLSWWNSSL